MINNRHGPHPAVSYYRSGAPPGHGLDWKNGASCDPRLLLEAIADNKLRVASCGLRVATHELRVAAHDCYRGRGRGAPVIPKIRDALAALGDCFAEISKRRGHKVELDPGNHRDAENAKKNLCSEGFATPWRTLRLNFLITEMDMSYGSMMT